MVEKSVRCRLDLAYDGTDFAGWAKQPGLRTVQGTIEDGLEQILRLAATGRPPVSLTVAGRTDSGVHARGQVAHVDLPIEYWESLPGRSDRTPAEALVTRMAGVLPPDVVIKRAAVAPEGFDARFSALARRYAYRIVDTPELRDPLSRNQVLYNRRPLDVEAMQAAVAGLEGLRDFAAFCKPREGATTIRQLQAFTWTRRSDWPDTGLIVGHIKADAFCHNMVRALVGASLAVGERRRPPEWLAEVLISLDRSRAAAVAPAHGLTLEEVFYPPDAELADRAAAVKAVREL